MCFHGNQLSWAIKHPLISLCFKYYFPGFICFPTMLAPVISSLDEIYCTQCLSVNEKWNNNPHYPDNKRWWEGQHPEGTFNHDWAHGESCGIYLPQSFKQNHLVTFKGNIFQIIYKVTWVPIKAALANRKKVANGANVVKFMNDWCFCLNLQFNFTRAHPLIRHPSLLGIFSKDPTFVC